MGTPAAPAAPPVIQLRISATLLLTYLALSIEGQVASNPVVFVFHGACGDDLAG